MEQMISRHLYIVEANPRLPRSTDAALAAVFLENLDPRHVRCADERGDFLFAIRHLLLAHDGKQSRQRAARRPLLFAIEDVMRAIIAQPTARLLSAGVATDVGLGEAKRAKRVRREAREPSPFLLFGAEEHDRLTSDRLMRADQNRGRSAVAPDALQHAVVACDPQPAAAKFAGNGHPKHA